jgi:hypothetical protein
VPELFSAQQDGLGYLYISTVPLGLERPLRDDRTVGKNCRPPARNWVQNASDETVFESSWDVVSRKELSTSSQKLGPAGIRRNSFRKFLGCSSQTLEFLLFQRNMTTYSRFFIESPEQKPQKRGERMRRIVALARSYLELVCMSTCFDFSTCLEE